MDLHQSMTYSEAVNVARILIFDRLDMVLAELPIVAFGIRNDDRDSIRLGLADDPDPRIDMVWHLTVDTDICTQRHRNRYHSHGAAYRYDCRHVEIGGHLVSFVDLFDTNHWNGPTIPTGIPGVYRNRQSDKEITVDVLNELFDDFVAVSFQEDIIPLDHPMAKHFSRTI